MQAFRDRKFQVIGFVGVTLMAAFLLLNRIDAIAFPFNGTDVSDEISALRATLPAAQDDGSVLENIAFDGNRVTLHLAGDGRMDLRTMRDGRREQKCDVWRKALHLREVGEVEYRYRQAGAVSSVFLDRSVCS